MSHQVLISDHESFEVRLAGFALIRPAQNPAERVKCFCSQGVATGHTDTMIKSLAVAVLVLQLHTHHGKEFEVACCLKARPLQSSFHISEARGP